ncbi:hypothetical protein J132_09024 [Termitomyces sp. J132]|nr:hypothetical protein J132_09024 [Termitomyces sp. J132]
MSIYFQVHWLLPCSPSSGPRSSPLKTSPSKLPLFFLHLLQPSSRFDIDPYLQYRPAFARSLPVQILLTGVVLTLVAVLFIHLIFTAQYHWPLAPVNYVLQLSGVTTLLISLIATLQVILSTALSESEKWPYMLSYIAVNVPPFDQDNESDEWNFAERATWLVMNAATSGLIQITHIQFLTLLYPSRLEGRLIFTLLGPLAIVAAVMQLLPMSDSDRANSIASAVRNVCNATLSLLFTAALLIWGLLVNRKNAWRTDGGTAAFGAAALTLALVSTALNFLYVPREEEYVWLPALIWAVILWQSFLGWWWWVGTGSASGLMLGERDILEKLEKEAKRELRRKEARERRRENKMRAKKAWKGVAGAFIPYTTGNRGRTSHPTCRIKSQRMDRSSPPPRSMDLNSDSPPNQLASSISSSSSSSNESQSIIPRLLPARVHRWYTSLRHAHLLAARQQAVERVERIREMERKGNDATSHGWGLGSFAWRIRRDQDIRPRPQEFEMYDHSSAWSHPESEPRSSGQDQELDRQTVEKTEAARHARHPPRSLPAPRQNSMWWWGPLARWRLQDSTSY